MSRKLAVGALAAATLLGAGMAQAAPEYTLKFGHLASEDNVWNKAAMKFKSLVEKNSDGRIAVRVYPNEQLGSEMEVINSIQLGTADMTITGESLQNWAPLAALMAVPYLFDSSEQMRKTIEGPIGEQIKQQVVDKTGLLPIAWFERGPRELTSNRPIRKPSDLDGLKLRVPNVPLFVKTWQALGARPTPMAFSEVFTSLQQGTIDAQENPLSLIESASFDEVQKYVNMTDHVRSWIYVVIGQQKFNQLPEDLQKVVMNAADQMQSYEHELFVKDQQRLRKTLKDHGMQFIEVDQQAFAEKARPAVRKALSGEQLKLYEKIQQQQQ
ncbi:TRAP transporter substrate-binding protein [Kushneria phosphatilytica]|uniref:TRAP transporter substrate-binding protein n=1 Tax=Kushneria phosphatilytica TaxID=657387 RepID=A0A1S1NV93_9GAMM|nr:TRAP transporter substrate-binding protein [Kushneria phosphatilytica]OHV10632.1 C4-dicarboxylate ABC transporter [Kushneria phosphatilytica]QEL12868.1 TRAP transporter substrate-binding protein [Kushneria phosphatilytica]